MFKFCVSVPIFQFYFGLFQLLRFMFEEFVSKRTAHTHAYIYIYMEKKE